MGCDNCSGTGKLLIVAPLMGTSWGVFAWKEFKDAPEGTNKILTSMFLFFYRSISVDNLIKVLNQSLSLYC